METGDYFCYTDKRELAIALVTLDIPLLEDGGYLYRISKKGEETVIWNLATVSRDGTLATAELMSHYMKGDEWFDTNPNHPLTLVVHAQRNLVTLDTVIEEDMPFATFELHGGRQLHARIGSEEYNEAISAGLNQL